MPSKSNERFLRADRKNRLEKHRLENTLKVFDRERSSKALEIDREKKGIAKSFDLVRKTSGRSDQGRPPRNRNDIGHLDAPVYQMGLRLSERRLMEWRAQEKELERSQSRSRSRIGSVMSLRDTNANKVNDKHVQSATSFSSEEEENSQYGSIKNLAFDPDELSRTIQEEYEALFRKCDIKIDLKYFNSYRDSKSQRRNTLQRPHTANAAIRNKGRSRSASLPVRPQTATSTNWNARESETDNIVSAVSEYSIISESDDNDDSVFEKPDQTKSDSSVNVQNNGVESGGESGNEVLEETTTIRKRNIRRRKPPSTLSDAIPEDEVFTSEPIVLERITNDGAENRVRKFSNSKRPKGLTVSSIPEENGHGDHSNNDKSDSESARTDYDSSSDVSGSRIRKFSGRQRKVSISTVSSEAKGSGFSSLFGSISDLSVDSNGNRRPSRWREFVAADNAPIPQQKSLVNVATVVRAALAFSRSARRRALDKLVEEQSTDASEIMRQERLRRLHSRNDILTAIANNWTISNDQVGIKSSASATEV